MNNRIEYRPYEWIPNDFSLKGTDKKIYTLEQFRGSKGLVVMFICNHCPYVKAITNQLVIDMKALEGNGISSIAIMSNDVINYPDDSPELMKKFAVNKNFSFPYLFDETQEVAKSFDAACTPDFFLYNNESKLVYRGQMDDSRPGNGIPVTGNDLKSALNNLIKNKEISAEQKPSIGCNIKWK